MGIYACFVLIMELLYIRYSFILSIMFTMFPQIFFIYYVSINNFLEQHVYNNMLFMFLILD